MADLNIIRQHIMQNGIDYCQFTLAQFLYRGFPDASELCLWIAVLVNLEIDQANVCLEIETIEQKSRAWGWQEVPPLDELEDIIRSCPLIGRPGDELPLIADNGKLYLHRYYHYEKSISEHLLARSGCQRLMSGAETEIIDRLFDQDSNSKQPDMQKIAAIVCSLHPLAIISGGPGTGKTYTVGKIMALLLEQQTDIKIQLAAPTGKAAMKLSQSINNMREDLPLDPQLRGLIPHEALTLHRLLAIDRYSHRPRYNHYQPLDCDLLVLDEASMIDQQMMALLCDALRPDARLILLGDKDQLSSVEAGSVFADLSGGLQQTSFNPQQQRQLQQAWQYSVSMNNSQHALADQLVVLDRSHRFDRDSAIGRIAGMINTGQSEQTIQLLNDSNENSNLKWLQLPESSLSTALKKQADGYYWQIMQAESIDQAFGLFHKYQILSALWSGPAGVDSINGCIEQYLKQKSGIDSSQQYYQGKPLMMTRNIYQYELYNGDVGIVWPDHDGQLNIWFETGGGEYRVLSLSQIPQHVTAYAMTVHKSQGSEFEHVLILLPSRESEVMSRELLYTAITRAARSVELWAGADIIRRTIEHKTLRVSGLLQRLQRAPAGTG